MDFMTLLKLAPLAISLIDTVRGLTAGGASNDTLASTIKNILPAGVFDDVSKYAGTFFETVKPVFQVLAAVQTAISPDRNKTVQGLLNVANDKMGLGLAPLVVDGDYGPKTKAMAMAVQRKLGGDVVADGWIGQASLGALQIFMQGVK